MFENEIGRASLQRLNSHFLTQGTGDKDKWSIGSLLLCDAQGRKSVERGQPVVGQNHRRLKALQFLQKARLRIDAPERKFKAAFFERMLRESGIVRLVFDH